MPPSGRTSIHRDTGHGQSEVSRLHCADVAGCRPRVRVFPTISHRLRLGLESALRPASPIAAWSPSEAVLSRARNVRLFPAGCGWRHDRRHPPDGKGVETETLPYSGRLQPATAQAGGNPGWMDFRPAFQGDH